MNTNGFRLIIGLFGVLFLLGMTGVSDTLKRYLQQRPTITEDSLGTLKTLYQQDYYYE